MNLVEFQVIFLGQYEEIFKNYIFTKKLWTYKGKWWVVLKDEGYGIIILALQSKDFGFGYPLTVPDLQTIHKYCVFCPKYVGIYASTTILGYTHK